MLTRRYTRDRGVRHEPGQVHPAAPRRGAAAPPGRARRRPAAAGSPREVGERLQQGAGDPSAAPAAPGTPAGGAGPETGRPPPWRTRPGRSRPGSRAPGRRSARSCRAVDGVSATSARQQPPLHRAPRAQQHPAPRAGRGARSRCTVATSGQPWRRAASLAERKHGQVLPAVHVHQVHGRRPARAAPPAAPSPAAAPEPAARLALLGDAPQPDAVPWAPPAARSPPAGPRPAGPGTWSARRQEPLDCPDRVVGHPGGDDTPSARTPSTSAAPASCLPCWHSRRRGSGQPDEPLRPQPGPMAPGSGLARSWQPAGPDPGPAGPCPPSRRVPSATDPAHNARDGVQTDHH